MTQRIFEKSQLSTAQMDRAIGLLLGTASGDALGAGYEFKPRVPYTESIKMKGGGPFGFSPGEWTDDTSMAICIAQVAAKGANLLETAVQDVIVEKWATWAKTAPDVGNQTRAVLSGLSELSASAANSAAISYAERNGHSGGNGSLMRTAPVVLAFLDSPDELWLAARAISDLTHRDQDAADACALWCMAMRDAILTGELHGPRVGLAYLNEVRRQHWTKLIDEAEAKQAWEFTNNGWVVHAFQAAWSAIFHTPVPADLPELGIFPAQHFQAAVERAVRVGNDTDTVAAIAGALLGARWGQSAIPSEWLAKIHGWPECTAADLVKFAVLSVQGGKDDAHGWPSIDRLYHPTDRAAGTFWSIERERNLLLAEQCSLGADDSPFDAVISLSRIGVTESPVDHPHQLTVRVMDSEEPEKNPHLDFQYFDVALQLRRWLDEDRRVLLHCVHTHNRTPNFLAAFLMYCHELSKEQALTEVVSVLPMAQPHGYLSERLDWITPRRLTSATGVYADFTLFADDKVQPTVLFAEAFGRIVQRKSGVWVQAPKLPEGLLKVPLSAIAAVDECGFSART